MSEPRGGYMEVEAAAGTAETITTADFMGFENHLDIQAVGDPPTRNIAQSKFDGSAPAPLPGWYCTVNGQIEVKASSAADALPEIDPILVGSGHVATVGADVGYELQAAPNAAANRKSCTCQSEDTADGIAMKCSGTRFGNLALNWKAASGRVMLGFDGLGRYETAVDTPETGQTDYGTLPFAVLADSGPFEIHSYAAILDEINMKWPITAVQRPNGGGTLANGYHEWPAHVFFNGNVTFDFLIELVDITAFSVFTKWKETAIDSGVIKWSVDVGGGSTRSLSLLLAATTFNAPQKVPGKPNMMHLGGKIHPSGGVSSVKWLFA